MNRSEYILDNQYLGLVNACSCFLVYKTDIEFLVLLKMGCTVLFLYGFLVSLPISVPAHGITGSFDSISGAIDFVFPSVASVFTSRGSVGSAISVPNYLDLNGSFNHASQSP